jgi:hypothetical protein
VIGQARVVRAFMRAEERVQGPFEVEIRECLPTTDPRSGRSLCVPPLVILWCGERPLAVRVRTVVALNRFPPSTRLASLVEGEALANALAVERMCEAGLWRLFSRPPRPRLAER